VRDRSLAGKERQLVGGVLG
jgi:L-fuconolactonase